MPMEDSLLVIDCVNSGRSSSRNSEVYRISGHCQQNNPAPIEGWMCRWIINNKVKTYGEGNLKISEEREMECSSMAG